MKRPERDLSKYAVEIASRLIHRLNDVEESDLIEALKDVYIMDGYEIAKELEARGYSPDAQMVEELDAAGSIGDDLHTDELMKWVKDNDIQPPYPIGTLVSVTTPIGVVQGEITKIYAGIAKYCVCCESAGHVKDGLGTHGFIFNYEDVRPVESTVTVAMEATK